MNTEMLSKTRKYRSYLSSGLWAREQEGLPLPFRLLRKCFRFGYLVFHSFFQDQCIIRAAALTFTTILSFVPFLAVAFSISKGFGLQNAEFIRNLLMRLTTGKVEVVDKIIGYINNTNVQTLGWVGVATLLFTVFSLIGTIERAFNTIWRVQKGRTAWRKVADFFPVILICPMFLIVASSFNVSLQKQDVVKSLLSISAISYLEAGLLKLAPLLFILIAFAFMYAFIPFTKVKVSSALFGGLIGGVLWQGAQWVYINWQIGAAKYNAIYGSFAQFPLLLMWLYISWVIVLLGAEVSYASQNLGSFLKQRTFGNASALEKQKIAVVILAMIVKRFEQGEELPCAEEISDKLVAPLGVVEELAELFIKAGFLVPVDSGDCERYAPARRLDGIRIDEIIRIINTNAGKRTGSGFIGNFGFVGEVFSSLTDAMRHSDHNVTLAECASRLGESIESIKDPGKDPERKEAV
ncbi:YihY/virulence factor BrkB family protein [Salidesulfovibrio brasiliensis]|uniref:YihY/virulence factor BrkB family protein n=1 Tax=Salidesulfovibrio brasiliensis TaxID=221711 RepID=UPI0006D06A82|nr:YihY/virulence factor BrkB family protein [Salidesulfovibrio brasiliensis]